MCRFWKIWLFRSFWHRLILVYPSWLYRQVVNCVMLFFTSLASVMHSIWILTDYWQAVRENNVPCAGYSQLRGSMHIRRHNETFVTSPVWTTGSMSEISYWILGVQATDLPEVLLRVWSCVTWNSWTGIWSTNHSGRLTFSDQIWKIKTSFCHQGISFD